ncbi:MAG: gyrase subunit, partial [Verrucomicrobiota bacterium]
CAQIDDPDITIEGLAQFVKGPDFPTGCTICGTKPIRQYFETGKGSIRIRGKAGVEEMKGNREAVIISEIPYNVNRAELIKRIADLVNEKILTDISAVRDESTEETRVVIELKRDANPKVVINNLYKHTALETTFSVAMLAIDHGRPKLLSLKEAITCYIEHRREVVLRRTRFLLRQAEELAEKLEGFLIALANLDDFIRIIRDSRDRDDARAKLMALSWTRAAVEKLGILIRDEARIVDGHYRFNERQVNSILDLRLYQLTGLERESIQKEYDDLLVTIKDLLDILARESRVFSIIKKELREIANKYGTERLTQVLPDEGEISIEDLIANEGTVITITHRGFLKRTAVSSYPTRNRGTTGMKGMVTREAANETEDDDFVEHLFTATTHDYLMFFTQSGRCYVERVFELPEMGRASKGRSIANFLQLRPDEKIAATIRIQGKKTDEETFSDQLNIVFATRSGIVKKSNLRDFKNMRKGGLIAIKIEEGDRLIDASLTDGNNELVLITRQGMSIRFHEDEVKPQSRDTIGVWGIRPEPGDEVVAAVLVNPACTLLVAGENGIGKRTPFEEYRQQGRGGKGVITMKTGDKTGLVAGALAVRETDDLMLITTKGKMVRTRVQQIRETSRNTMGVKLIELKPGSKLQAIAPVISQESDNAGPELEGLEIPPPEE